MAARSRPWEQEFSDFGSRFIRGDAWCEAWRNSGLPASDAAMWATFFEERPGFAENVRPHSDFYIAEAVGAETHGLTTEEWAGWDRRGFNFNDGNQNIAEWLASGITDPEEAEAELFGD